MAMVSILSTLVHRLNQDCNGFLKSESNLEFGIKMVEQAFRTNSLEVIIGPVNEVY